MDIIQMAQKIGQGDRRTLARAITLVESTRADHRGQALDLLAALDGGKEALRIGLSGTPGVGKSTFIEAFGLHLIAEGLKVAVLAVDPSSARSGGSILGDKTRMEQLSRHSRAFIRPSPSQTQMGGVARHTREATQLCEAAGYDVVIIETVGVGQSETMVADMSDLFVLLMAPAGGDELQGVKRGIMEKADLILINKADGDLKAAATRTCADYAGALRLLRKRPQDMAGFPKAAMVSALTEDGLAQAWRDMQTLSEWRKVQGIWATTRADQALFWFRAEVQHTLLSRLAGDAAAGAEFAQMAQAVKAGHITPSTAAARVIAQFLGERGTGSLDPSRSSP